MPRNWLVNFLTLPVDYFRRQVEEIQRDRVLRWYGSCLAFLYVIAATFWLTSDVAKWLQRGPEAICWPMFPHCQQWHLLGYGGVRAALWGFLLLGVTVMALFLNSKWTRAAYWGLFTLNLIKIFIWGLDYRFHQNHHLMTFWVTLPFLFLPCKKKALQFLIPFLYFWAGTLKLNEDWLSGILFDHGLWPFTGVGLRWACGYAVVLELFLVWGLWAQNRILAWVTLAQLFLFHVESYFIVGYFYPLLMFAILAIYPLDWLAEKKRLTFRSFAPHRNFIAGYGLVFVFTLVQIPMKLMPGDTGLTGEGRLWAVSMFDSRPVCSATATLKGEKPPRELSLVVSHPNSRLICDPVVYLSRARHLCHTKRALKSTFKDLDLAMVSRRPTDSHLHRIIAISDFCSKPIQYSIFTPNDWILKN